MFIKIFSLLPAWSPEDEYAVPHTPDIEEYNILYVAVTRAKKSLILTRALARILKDAGVSPSLAKPPHVYEQILIFERLKI